MPAQIKAMGSRHVVTWQGVWVLLGHTGGQFQQCRGIPALSPALRAAVPALPALPLLLPPAVPLLLPPAVPLATPLLLPPRA